MELAARTEDLWESFKILPQKEIPKFHLLREILKFQNLCVVWGTEFYRRCGILEFMHCTAYNFISCIEF
ncbi:hypothetical protein [Campylobacter gracilis]|uniref:Uncharacterized protein n=1 Tax=Campylobacter gracilis RM3268 TaxID=553220 RepID=C8PH98_9BACT|nr:hypothetical protein [Campylobacter gracilis]EEV17919.1 hypothetical protein CAMGR0001_2292 [Campylobacter gracilis RM3268]UEB46431.1 hypothetical protein LK410_04900 [Campylobacter gracilis]